jgi:cell division protein FtsW
VFALFAVLAWKGWQVSLAQSDSFARMTGVGITTFLSFQMLINLAVVSGMVPATGVTLPYFSYGGTSILISLLMGGLLLNLSRRVAA